MAKDGQIIKLPNGRTTIAGQARKKVEDYIKKHPDARGVDIAKAVGLDPSTVSRALARIESKSAARRKFEIKLPDGNTVMSGETRSKIEAYLALHPYARQADVAQAIGVARNTVAQHFHRMRRPTHVFERIATKLRELVEEYPTMSLRAALEEVGLIEWNKHEPLRKQSE